MDGLQIRSQRTEQRERQILDAALELFCEKGIEDTSIEEVARAAGVGPATIYRYFETKAELAVSSGIACWKKIQEKYAGRLTHIKYQNMRGSGQLQCIFHILGEVFENEPQFLKFLQEFDIFVQRRGVPGDRLAEYEGKILNLKPYVTDALELGLRDGSLEFAYTVDEVYVFVMRVLAGSSSFLTSDERTDPARQVKIAGELLLGGLGGGR